jgi:hypothetical protein
MSEASMVQDLPSLKRPPAPGGGAGGLSSIACYGRFAHAKRDIQARETGILGEKRLETRFFGSVCHHLHAQWVLCVQRVTNAPQPGRRYLWALTLSEPLSLTLSEPA